MRLLATVAMLGLIAAAPAAAQTGAGNPAGMSPGTPQSAPGTPAPHHPNAADRLFVQQATIGGSEPGGSDSGAFLLPGVEGRRAAAG